MPQHSEIALPEIAYNRTDYTALRAYCSGVEVRIIADRYYSDNSPELEQGLERFLKRMRNHLVDRALESHPAHADILRNARDKRHITSCFFNNGCYYGASRTFVGSLRYSW